MRSAGAPSLDARRSFNYSSSEGLTKSLASSDIRLRSKEQACCHTDLRIVHGSHITPNDSAHPQPQTCRCSCRATRLRVGSRYVNNGGRRSAGAPPCDGGCGPSSGHALAEEATLRGRPLDPIAAGGSASWEQGLEQTTGTKRSSAATHRRAVCAGATAMSHGELPIESRGGY